MILNLTAEQAEQVRPLMVPGRAILGRVTWHPYSPGNESECGTLLLEYGSVPESSLENLREVIRSANEPPKPKRRKPAKREN